MNTQTLVVKAGLPEQWSKGHQVLVARFDGTKAWVPIENLSPLDRMVHFQESADFVRVHIMEQRPLTSEG